MNFIVIVVGISHDSSPLGVGICRGLGNGPVLKPGGTNAPKEPGEIKVEMPRHQPTQVLEVEDSEAIGLSKFKVIVVQALIVDIRCRPAEDLMYQKRVLSSEACS